MFWEKYIAERDNATMEIRFMRLVLAGVAVVAIIEAGVVFKLAGNEKVILVPPEIKRTVWVSGSAVSKEYLEEMAYWYLGLALNITPAVSEYQTTLFLKYAAPSEFGRLQSEMGARAAFLKKNNTATEFSVRTIAADERSMKVAFTGTLITWASDKKAGERSATFLIGFKFLNGRLHVSEFKETSDSMPFDSAPAVLQPAVAQPVG